ncbi:MAG: sulfatase-like hydrolase/transferase [Planctomycetes bacterium]|nr:sulfatase-like hydrolase/transferase [Planctomycetota bacterium]
MPGAEPVAAAEARPGMEPRPAGQTRPNVVLIFTDDQGTIDVNCCGAADLHTPSLDALARRGTRFTQFYVAAPVCSPSRAALLTGRYPQRAGLAGNAPSHRGGAGMPAEQVTIAEMLKAAGYATGHVGKWHLGYTPETMPNAQGFGESFGHMGGCIDNYSHFFYWSPPNLHDLWRDGEEVWRDGEFFGDLMVAECIRFIEKNRSRPFFLYWAINMPHYPLQAQERFRAMYEDLEEPRRSYAAFISTLDEKIGRVVGRIDDLGLRERTIIIFLSDHGHSEEIRNNFGGSGGSAGPHRGHKFTLWEGGVRVPCIVSWPGRIPENEVRGQVAISMDWLPTIAHYCSAPLPERRIDGRSIAQVIASAESPSPHDALHWHTGGAKGHWAVRRGEWKLVHGGPASELRGVKIPAAKEFLADLSADPGESRNLAAEHPEIVESLTELHEEWAAEVERQ